MLGSVTLLLLLLELYVYVRIPTSFEIGFCHWLDFFHLLLYQFIQRIFFVLIVHWVLVLSHSGTDFLLVRDHTVVKSVFVRLLFRLL